MAKGPLIIVSGPSGCGKSTVIKEVLKKFAARCGSKAQPRRQLRQSISATTREPRKGEVEGVHYHFWSDIRFKEELDRDGFLEHAEVHKNCYGTPRSEVERYLDRGIGVVLVIDVQGAAQVRTKCSDHLSIFLKTSTLKLLEERLRGRGTDSEEAIQTRLANARTELKRRDEYQHEVINDDLDTCVNEMCELIEAEFRRREGDAG